VRSSIEMAMGRHVDIAINHDEAAIRMHKMNHPNTVNYQEDVREVDPIACHDLGFEYLGFELDPDYYRMASKRLERFKNQVTLFDISKLER